MDDTLSLFIILGLMIIVIVGLLICLALALVCGFPAETMCEKSVTAGAAIAFAATAAALGGASTIAWTLYRRQTKFTAEHHLEEDRHHREQNGRLDRIERKIDKILGGDVGKKD